MFSEQVILHINIACIAFLSVTMVILISATRLKNGAGYMALVSASTTIPVYLSNLMRTLGSGAFEASLYVAVTLNVMCFPFLWFFVCSQLDREFRFTPRKLWHLLPSLISLVAALCYYVPMNAEGIAGERKFLEAGNENLPALINDVLLFGQFFVYFPLMFRFVNRKKRYILENYTDSDYVLLLWLPHFLWLFFILFFIVFIAYVITPPYRRLADSGIEHRRHGLPDLLRRSSYFARYHRKNNRYTGCKKQARHNSHRQSGGNAPCVQASLRICSFFQSLPASRHFARLVLTGGRHSATDTLVFH